MVKVIGLEISYLAKEHKRKIIVEEIDSPVYINLIYSDDKPLTRDSIISFIAGHFNIIKEDVIWPKHIKIP